MSQNSNNLWAPWRIPYIQNLKEPSGCFLCHDRDNPDDDDENLVLWRTPLSMVVLNRFPYNNGHLLIAPKRHIADIDDATDDEMLEIMKLVRETKRALAAAVNPHGFNVGINFGREAGAGLPEHWHVHVVPRWDGDTNFMSVCAKTKVISQSLDDLLIALRKVTKEMLLPSLK
jgi:ATP adenylyltransferase